jgi:hypothetical protein
VTRKAVWLSSALAFFVIHGVAFAELEPKCVENSPERHGEFGCTYIADKPLPGPLEEPLFWHIDRLNSGESASAAAGPSSVAFEARRSLALLFCVTASAAAAQQPTKLPDRGDAFVATSHTFVLYSDPATNLTTYCARFPAEFGDTMTAALGRPRPAGRQWMVFDATFEKVLSAPAPFAALTAKNHVPGVKSVTT